MNLPSRKSFKKIILVLLGVLAIVVLAYLLVVRPIQVRQEKKQFEQAAAELEKLYTRIEAVAGKPDQIKREKTCDRANLKNAKGSLRCNTNIYLLYDGAGPERATELRNLISSAKEGSLRPELSEMNKDFTGDQKTQQIFYQNYTLANLKCTTSYRYPAKAGLYDPFVPNSNTGLALNMSCGGQSLAQHYPLRD